MNIEEFIEKSKNEKIKIIDIWLNLIKIKNIIEQYDLDLIIIKKRYAFSNLEYYLEFLKGDKPSGNSTIVIDFLKYLKNHNIRANDLYIIYTEFKNALIKFSFLEKLESLELLDKINQTHQVLFYEILTVFEQSNAQIEKALNKSIDIVDKFIIMSRTDNEGYITSVSSAFCEISGYKDYELIGKKHTILRDKEVEDNFYKELWDTINSGEIWIGEIKNIKKNGEYYWVKTTIHPNFDNIGNMIGFDAIYQDITASVKLKNHQNILIEQSKSAAMGEMISMIAHQWRQPLQAVSILVQKLSLLKMIDGKISDELLEEVVQQVIEQLDYMSKTIDDFRDYFKPNKKKEKVLINEVIEKSLSFVEYLFRINNVKIKYSNSSNVKLNIYLNEIVQVLINLSKNSCDAMIEREIKDRFINIQTFDKDEYLFIEFEDSAGGINDKIINNIFDPYFSTKHNKNGTGLGLYMSREIIQKHSNGDIFVENTQSGSKFTIKLPLK